jgi:non-specific serine/threonine protein kinase
MRRAELQNEMHVITKHLASAVGFGGRDRKIRSDVDRARCAVTKCIKKTIQRIADAIPPLGYHLAARIKTGYFCSYNAHPKRTVDWKFQPVVCLPCVTLEVTM